MIPGDLGAELSAAVRTAVEAGELPAAAVELSLSGTWRPAPAGASAGPGTYATSLPFVLARLTGQEPARHARALAVRLTTVPWVAAASGTGQGYLTVTVTTGHLRGLARRIVAAGPASLASGALAGNRLTVPGLPDLTAASSWQQAWRAYAGALVGRLAQAAGADVLIIGSERDPASPSPVPGRPGPVPAAVARFGRDAVGYALARTASGAPVAIERQLTRPLDLSNPFVLVSYAHADAASTLRWAGDLWAGDLWAGDLELAGDRLTNAEEAGSARPAAPESGSAPEPSPTPSPGPGPAPAPQPAELGLLHALSWLPERLAAAARRRRPAELADCLEWLASAWLDCRESCPALPFGGQAALADAAGTAARLELADAARTVLGTGLSLLGVTAPTRL